MTDDIRALYVESSVAAPEEAGAPGQLVAQSDDPFAAARPSVDAAPSPSVGGSDSTRSQLRPGTLIAGIYELHEEVGAGGMGRVYRAHDRRLHRDVAIKFMRERTSEHEDGLTFRQRFEQEARLPASLQHPNIISIYDLGEHGGLAFFVMEYIVGARSLHLVVDEATARQTPLPLPLVRAYFSQAARALRAIHATPGTWHRDVKLDNLLVFELPGGEPALKILDFGIAHNPDAELTASAAVLGTPTYMSPEYFEFAGDRPVELDHRSDLFALGIALYRCLTLHHPYPGVKSVRDAMAHYASRELRPYLPSHHRPELPPGWDYVTMRLLERDRTRRYQSAAEVVADLDRLAELGPYTGDGARTESTPVPSGTPPTVRPPAAAGPALAPVPVPIVAASSAPPPGSPMPSSAPVTGLEPTPPSQLLATPGEWAAAWQQPPNPQRRKALGRALLAGAAAVVTLIVATSLVWVTDALQLRSHAAADAATERAWNMPGQARSDPDQWVEDTKAASPFAAQTGALPTLAATATPLPSATSDLALASNPDGPPSPSASPAPRRVRGNGALPASAAGNVPAAADNPWAQMFGTRSEPNAGALVARPTETSATQANGSPLAKGLRLRARLVDAIASVPSGAPVVAQLPSATRLGSHQLPSGTEVHGVTEGGQGSRVFVRFQFVRLKGGQVIQLNGVALGTDGRPGIPGTRQVDSGAADVGMSAAGAAVREGAAQVADAVGQAVGAAAVRAAGGKAADKTERLGGNDEAVVAKRATVFVVYVEALDAPAPQ